MKERTQMDKEGDDMGKKKRTDYTLKGAEGRLIDEVCLADRKWFEEHPNETEYVRPYRKGEYYPSELESMNVVGVRVVKITDSIRARIPITGTTTQAG